MEKLYSVKDIQKLFGFKGTRIRYWDKIGFLTPSVKIGARKYYISQDLIGLKTARGLLDAGFSFAEVKRTVTDMKRISSAAMRPHSLLFIHGEGKERANPFSARRQPLIGFSEWDFKRGIRSAHKRFQADVRPERQKSRRSRRNLPGRRGSVKSKNH